MRVVSRILIVLARICLGVIFVASGYGKIIGFNATEQFMAAHGMTLVPLFLVGAIIVEILGGLAFILGIKTRWAALILALYLIPVTAIFHAFWNEPLDARQMQIINFLKNLSIFGGLLYVFAVEIAKHCFCKKNPSDLERNVDYSQNRPRDKETDQKFS